MSRWLTPEQNCEMAQMEARLKRRIEARQQQADAEAREREWAKTSAVLREEVAAQRQAHAAERQAAGTAIEAEGHELLWGVTHVRDREEAARVRRLIERFGSSRGLAR